MAARTTYLDGVRGLASLCVLSGHMIGGGGHELGFGQVGNYSIVSFPIIRLLYSGAPAAVSVFFVLSGYVVSNSSNLLSAVVRRPFRLYLPCFAITFIVALSYHLPIKEAHPPWIGPADTILDEVVKVIKSWTYFWPIPVAVEAFYPYDHVVWTIPLELVGSYICYALTAVHRRYNIWPSVLVAITSIVLLSGFWWQACFLAGYTLRHLDGKLAPFLALPSLLIMSVPQASAYPHYIQETPIYRFLPNPPTYHDTQHYRFWTSVGAIAFVYSTLHVSWLQRFFDTRPLQYLGKVSFMLYLIHYPLAFAFSDRFIRIFGYGDPGEYFWDSLLWMPDWGGKGLSPRWFVAWSSVLAINLALSHFLTIQIDERSVRMSRMVSTYLGVDKPRTETQETAEELNILPK